MNQSAAAQSGDGTPVTGPAQQSLAEPSASRPVASDPRDKHPSVPDHELLSRIGRGSYGDVWLGKNAVGTSSSIRVNEPAGNGELRRNKPDWRPRIEVLRA